MSVSQRNQSAYSGGDKSPLDKAEFPVRQDSFSSPRRAGRFHAGYCRDRRVQLRSEE